MQTLTRLCSAVLLTLGAGLSPLASADAVNATHADSVQVPVGSLDALFISKTFTANAPRTLVIHYSAECQIQRGHVEYDIVVNRANLNITSRQVPPTHDNFSALCSNDGGESSLRAVTAGTTVACTVTRADSYTVKVRGHVESPDNPASGTVDDQSLVIVEHPYSDGLPPCVTELPGT